ncbi:MAG: inner membrane CreD family protein [Proteobacteria bacterium]|nr:inner membrane CreD family protein [Pseudomonadota bacterium]
MAQNPIAGLIPRGSLGLKLLLVCLLVLVMGIPLVFVGGLVGQRETRAAQVTAQIGQLSGGQQIVGGPMLLIPYQRSYDAPDDQGRVQHRTEQGNYVVFAETGAADSTLTVEQRRRGIYRAAVYNAAMQFSAHFAPESALRGVDPSYRFDWSRTRILMFVSDSRAIRNAAQVRFADGGTATFEPVSDLSVNGPPPGVTVPTYGGVTAPAYLTGLQAFAAAAPLATQAPFDVQTRLDLSGAQRFAFAAFAQDTTARIHGNRRDASAEGYFQSNQPLQTTDHGFTLEWRVPFVARGLEKAADLKNFSLGQTSARDMAVSFVDPDDIYRGVGRAVAYGIMFIGIVFLATLIFEAVSGKKAHPAQYILVGLAQCVFYLLLLSLTELMGFTLAFIIAAAATVGLLAYYAGASFKSQAVGVRALMALAVLYGAMYVLMTLEDFALLAGSVVAFAVIAATMIATRRIDWYGRNQQTASTD